MDGRGGARPSRAGGGMADAHALGACGVTRGGSSPLPPINLLVWWAIDESVSTMII